MEPPALQPNGIASGTILRRRADGSCECLRDDLTIEEPLEIRVRNRPLAVTMRTPGHDEELAAGFLLSEGIIRERTDVRELAHCQLSDSPGNILQVALAPHVKFEEAQTHRFGTISTSCGLCGKTSIATIRQQFAAIDPARRVRISTEVLLQLPDWLRDAQSHFAKTGGIHAAGIFTTAGELLIAREDIGRHNAVDKAIGAAFLRGWLPLAEHVLMVSGRSSLEIVQKALAAGIPIVASVSAPSTLAVNFAREAGQTLIGFLRPPTFNLYSHIERVPTPTA